MTFLPVVSRELRVAARKRATYFARMGAVLAAILVGTFVAVAFRGMLGSPKDLGQALFVTLSILSFIYCIGTGLLSTSDCLSVEKREGTLGLLFLTDLKGYDVVMGKLVACSLN